VMEALAMGVPVITANTRGCREVVRHGVDGLVLQDCSPDALAPAMRRLAEDVAQHRSLALAALAGRNRFTRTQFVAEQIATYLRLTAERFPAVF
jgi:glycosyltransferase involved in cell wall biosynthesis